MRLSRRAVLAAPLFTLAAAPAGIPGDFTGLSFEAAELVQGALLTPENRSLVALVRRLGRAGVIRIGGNSSDRERRPPAAAAIARLGGFLRATGWSLLYGLDLGNGRPEAAALQAAMVAEAAGPALIAFQIGNEPDLFDRSLRRAGWGFPDYLAAWERFAAAILQRLPAARFAGPDIAVDTGWVRRFAMHAEPRPVLLTRHFYAEGPGSSPAVTIPRLLASRSALLAAARPAERAARAAHLPLRMSETNSVYSGGRPGVSNTLAAACWGGEMMFRLGARGWAGVNFHDRPIRSYAPIGAASPLARPLYYGMLLYAVAEPRSIVPRPAFAPLAAYEVTGQDGHRRLALFNLDPDRARSATLPAPFAGAMALRLAAVSPASAEVTLGGARVADDAGWHPRPEHPGTRVSIAPASALLLRAA